MTYLPVFIIVGAIVGVFIFLIKKDNERLAGYVAKTTEEQKAKLAATEITLVDGKKNVWTQTGMICDAKIKSESKVALVVLYHNKVIQNNTYNQIEHADLNISKAEFDSHNLKVGDFVKIYIDPEKGAKVIF